MDDIEGALVRPLGVGAKAPFRCSGCAVEISMPGALERDICPYCEGTLLQQEDGSPPILPGALLPFEIDRDEAEALIRATWERVHEHSGERALRGAPNLTLFGVYIPYWELKAASRVAYEVRRDSIQNRAYVLDHEPQIFLAADGLERACSVALRKWDVSRAVAYDPTWVAGFLVEHPSIPTETTLDLAHRSFSGSARSAVSQGEDLPHRVPLPRWRMTKSRTEVGLYRYNTWIEERFYKIAPQLRWVIDDEGEEGLYGYSAQTENVKGRVLLAPIWLGRIHDGDASYLVAVNGQNGDVGGQRPSMARDGTYGLIFGLGALILVFLAAFRWE
ncbi:MAG: hypothetical protein AAGG09_08815 [Pseudomonadota bacterium]